MKKTYKVLLRVFISGTLIIILLKTQNLPAIKASLLSFSLPFLGLALLMQLTSTLFSSIRWKTILQTSNLEVSHWRLMALYLKGYFYNNFLPTQMGGDVYKSVALGNQIKDQSTSLFSVFMDRFSGLIVLLVMALFGIGSLFGATGIAVSLGLLIIGLVIYFPMLKIMAKKVKFFKKFKQANDLFLRDKKRGVLVLMYSLFVQLTSFAMVYVLFLGMGVTLPLWSVFAFMPVISLSLLIPSFNGFGTQETVYAVLFKNLGITNPVSISVSIMVHVTRLIMSLIGGLLILFGIGGDNLKQEKNDLADSAQTEKSDLTDSAQAGKNDLADSAQAEKSKY